jgi:hypothetical protein
MKLLGPQREEVAGGWRRLHNEELHNLYASLNIRAIKSRKVRWARYVERMGQMRNAYKLLVRKPEGKRPLVRPRRRWECKVRMDLKEIRWEDVDWIHLAQDRDQ